MAIADYLRKLVEMKNQLVANLNSMGVEAQESEKLNTLVPKVLECKAEQNMEFVDEPDLTGSSKAAGFINAISKVKIPDSVTSIGDYAFVKCNNLKSITIPDSVTSIGQYAFAWCENLNKGITIPNGVTSIGNYAFYDCPNLESITIPDSVTSIGQYAFYECSSLTSIVIPDGVTSFSDCLLFRCSGLTSVVIPDGVTSFGTGVFMHCVNLAHIYYKGTQTQWDAITKGTNWNYDMGKSVSGGTVIHYNYTG